MNGIMRGDGIYYLDGVNSHWEFRYINQFDPPYKVKDPRNFLGTITNYNKNAYPNDGISRRFLLYS